MRLLILTFFAVTSPIFLVAQKNLFKNSKSSPFSIVEPDEVNISRSKLNRLNEEIQTWVKTGELVGAELLLLKENKIFFHKTYGWSDREKGQPVKPNSIWSIKSMTKPFTATAIMLLVEEGKISLEDKITNYLPDFAGDPSTTIGNLISHTTGYRQTDYGTGHRSLEEWILQTTSSPHTGTFGSYEYSDIGFGAAAYIVEKVSGQSIEEFIFSHIIDPLGLNNTSTKPLDKPDWKARLNSWYNWDNDIKKYLLRGDSNRHPWSFSPGSSGMYATAMDYARFLSVFLNRGYGNGNQILQSKSVEIMTEPHAYQNGIPVYGYGWHIRMNSDKEENKIFWHSGYDGTVVFAYPTEELMVIYMTQSRGGKHLFALPDRLFMYGITEIPSSLYLSRWKDTNDPVVSLSRNEAQEFEGFYLGKIPESGEELLIQVGLNNNQLEFRMNAFGLQTDLYRELAYLGTDYFALGKFHKGELTWTEEGTRLKFNRNENAVRSVDLVFDDKVQLTAKKADRQLVLKKLRSFQNRHFADDMIEKELENNGLHKAALLSRQLHEMKPDTVVLAESLLNNLGYRYLRDDKFASAIAVFEMNIEAYPESPNCHDSLADAWKRKGNLGKAREYYQYAVDLAREKKDARLKAMEQRLDEVKELIRQKQ